MFFALKDVSDVTFFAPKDNHYVTLTFYYRKFPSINDFLFASHSKTLPPAETNKKNEI